MSLQGTLDSFPIPDILRFLAAGRKTGRLSVVAPAGDGDVWLANGEVVAAETRTSRDPADTLVALLRLPEGTFEFHDAEISTEADEGRAVEDLLADAEGRAAAWAELEAVVPDVECIVDLVTELGSDDLTLTAAQWRMVVGVAREANVAAVRDRLAMSDFEACSGIAELVEMGLVVVGDVEAVVRPKAVAVEADERARRESARPDADAATAELTGSAWRAEESTDVVTAEADVDVADDEVEVTAEQIAELGPEAVKAVEEAAKATTDDERDAALEGVADDDPANRGLLLKFLSSVQN